MNLMFRKNFREPKSGCVKNSSTRLAGRHPTKRASREQGYTPIEEHHYRTHLFFAPPRCTYTSSVSEESEEPRCGPMTGGGSESFSFPSIISPAMTETDLPQPLIVRSPSDTLLKWPPNNKTTPTRQFCAIQSAGPRSCVGRKYAMLKLKVLLATILRKYKITSPVSESEFKLQGDIILKRADGFRIQIEERQKA